MDIDIFIKRFDCHRFIKDIDALGFFLYFMSKDRIITKDWNIEELSNHFNISKARVRRARLSLIGEAVIPSDRPRGKDGRFI